MVHVTTGKVLGSALFLSSVVVMLAAAGCGEASQDMQAQQGALPPLFKAGAVITSGAFYSGAEDIPVFEIKEVSGQWVRVVLLRSSRDMVMGREIGQEMWLEPSVEV